VSKINACIYPLLLSVGSTALAQNKIQVRTFGSVGYSRLMSSKPGEAEKIINYDTFEMGQIKRDVTSYDGADKGGTWRRNTRFGFNLSGELSTDLSFSLGILTEAFSLENGPFLDRGAYPLRATVASLNYEGIRNLSVQFGHLPAPFWLISEEKFVGYTYPWIRPPFELYSIPAVTENLEGIRAIYQFNVGDFLIKPSLFGGDFPVTLVDGFKGNYRGGGFKIDLEWEWLTAQIGMVDAIGVIDDKTVIGTTTVPTSDGGTASVEQLRVSVNGGSSTRFNTIGVRATPGDFLIMAEAADAIQERYDITGADQPFSGLGSHPRAYYVTLGYNIGRFMPRVTYSQLTDEFTNIDKWVSKPLIDQAAAEQGQDVADRLQRAILREYSYDAFRTIQLGLNFVVTPSAILKVEYQTSKANQTDFDGAFGMLSGGEANIAQIAIDFVQ
jgi:hypothetical protein